MRHATPYGNDVYVRKVDSAIDVINRHTVDSSSLPYAKPNGVHVNTKLNTEAYGTRMRKHFWQMDIGNAVQGWLNRRRFHEESIMGLVLSAAQFPSNAKP